MYPMQLIAPCKDYLWGGTRLREEFGKTSDKEKIAESWELSCHKDGVSRIANGKYAGMLLTEYLEHAGKAVLGTRGAAFRYFPVLIKLIDAKDNLSVQVHPDNEYALRVEGEYGKTEMWYIVDCEPGAKLIYGFAQEITKEEFRRRIADNTLLEAVHQVPVHKGDVFFIAAGTLHAIGAGILIAEIQQNSNTTYRVYDYGRVGADGKPRALHIDKAAEVTRLAPAKPYPASPPREHAGYTETLLAGCEYFTARRLDLHGAAKLDADEASFHHILLTEGHAVLTAGEDTLTLKKGASVFLPAGLGAYTLDGTGQAILTTV